MFGSEHSGLAPRSPEPAKTVHRHPQAPPLIAWTQESLEALNARDIEYDGGKYTAYEISQMQRAKERTVRKYKRRYLAEDAAGTDTTASAVKLR